MKEITSGFQREKKKTEERKKGEEEVRMVDIKTSLY